MSSMNPLYEKIAKRAYEIYISKGQRQGSDLDDWLQAEREFAGSEKPGAMTYKSSNFAGKKTKKN